MCPVETDQVALDEHSYVYEGRKVRFCCEDCLEAFKENPKKYLANLAAAPAGSPAPGGHPHDHERGAAAGSSGHVHGAGYDASEEAAETGTFTKPGLLSRWTPDHRTSRRYQFLLIAAGVVIAASLLGRIPKLGALRRVAGGRLPLPAGLALIAAGLVGDFFYFREKALELEDAKLADKIHFATFTDYGYPPVPKKPPLPKQLEATYYRGNDERSPKLFNGGLYRTAVFKLSLVDGEGNVVKHGSRAQLQDLTLKLVTERAPNTPDFFWTADRMAQVFATKKVDKILGRDEPVEDAVFLETTKPMQEWVIRYPLGNFDVVKQPDGTESLAGIVYLCERKYGGGRYHFAVQLALSAEDGVITADSDLWMGSLYRTRKLPVWAIADNEWFSHEPLPVLPEPGPADPKLAGISDYTEGPEAEKPQ